MSRSLERLSAALQRLADTVAARKEADPAISYTARLLSQGVDRIAKKLGEEAVELVIASIQGDPDAVAAECADLFYHLLVLLEATGVAPDAVAAKLEARQGVSGVEEKAARSTR